MVNADTLRAAFRAIAAKMAEKRNYLIELDQRNGDGDLGISMSEGYAAASAALEASEETDLGRLCIAASKAFNEAAPSSLGTITSFCLMGMAKVLKGHTEADMALLGEALEGGLAKVMEKAGSKPGEKTILDAVCPAAEAIRAHAAEGDKAALTAAAKAAAEGSDSTANMPAVHGRAAYYGEKAIGLIDGGSVAGRFIFEALAEM
ncbi:MAG: dihydroxyacetone kinase subunit L [Clostridia bacterium]|nr:dihydroxyacetone kinase subunit L [Clostridia bacterium]